MKADTYLPFIVLAAILMVAEFLYFRIAIHYRIIDKPNQRSSHEKPVIRGGGVIFIVAIWLWFFYEDSPWVWFSIGLTAAAIVSFLDDVTSQAPVVRILIHLIAVALMFYQADLFLWPIWLVLLALIVSIGTLNAFNFMDGINGITGVYALVTLLSFAYINQVMTPFTDETLIWTTIIAVAVFLFFNFRTRARCFAGDVGSVTLAFILVFLLLQLIRTTGNYAWALMFLVYGVDSVVTIIYRLKNRENIFQAHRTHLYQFLSNELKIPHLRISILYGIVQLIVNLILILYFREFNWFTFVFFIVTLIIYVIIREAILKRIYRQGSPSV